MRPFEHAIPQHLVARICDALIQFTWQGAAVALLLALALFAMRRRSALSRYTACCAALLLMAVCPLLTLSRPLPAPSASACLSPHMPEGRTATATPMNAPQIGIASPNRLASPDPAPPEPYRSIVVAAWLLGVLVLSLRLMGGGLAAARLSRRGVSPLPVEIDLHLQELLSRMLIRRPVRLLQSACVQVPVVVGCFRAVILMPITATTGISAGELQALLAHELAHIRRCDYLVNIAQSLVETLLFYHPAVWWVSGRMRREREICCDDAALRALPDRTTYARALAAIEELRGAGGLLAPGAGGGDLPARIRHILGVPPSRMPVSPLPAAAGFTLALLLLMTVALISRPAVAAHGAAEEDAASIARSVIRSVKYPDASGEEWHHHEGTRSGTPEALPEAEWITVIRTMRDLRDHWRVWAGSHRDLLRRLASARPDDLTLMRQVWDAIPADPRPLNGGKLIEPHPGPFQVDIFFYWTGGTGSQSTRFEWMGGTKLHQPKEYPVSSQLWRSIYWAGQYHEHWMVWEFHRIRDVAVARSSTRPVEFTLWASGRITEDYWTFLPHAGKGAWNMDVDYKTIDPPFPPSGEPNH